MSESLRKALVLALFRAVPGRNALEPLRHEVRADGASQEHLGGTHFNTFAVVKQ